MTCPHGELHPAACPDCVDGAPATVRPNTAPPVDAGRILEALYPGRCANDQRHEIEPGDPIAFSDDVDGFVCERCAR